MFELNNTVRTKAGAVVVGEFQSFVETLLTEDGIWPLPMIALTANGGEVEPLECSDMQAAKTFFRICSGPGIQAAMFGLDQLAEPETQRTEFPDVLTCVLFQAPENPLEIVNARDLFSFGVIEYHFKPRVVRPVNWHNAFWIREMKTLMQRFVPDRVYGASGKRSAN